MLHAQPQTGTRGKVMRAARGTATVARIFISSSPYHPSSPSFVFLLPPLLTRRVDLTVLETVQIKQVKMREGRRRSAKENGRKTERRREKEGATVEGNGGVQHEPFAPCTICCTVASKTLRPGFAGTPYAYCIPRRYYRRLRRFYCFKYRTCRA